jgi:hypothetical protein
MELKGKPLSLVAKILGAIIAIGALVLKATISPTLDIDAALKVAAFVVLVFAPVDVSMVMGNIFTGMEVVSDNNFYRNLCSPHEYLYNTIPYCQGADRPGGCSGRVGCRA